MEFYRDKDLEDELVNKIVSNWKDNVRIDIHLSDLISPRKAFFNRKVNRPPTKDDIFSFLVGDGIENKLGKLLEKPHDKTTEKYGIYFSPDFRLPHITELKSRRRNLAKEGEELNIYGHYLKQLKGYMALTGENEGNLLVFSIAERFDETGKTKPELAAYKVWCDNSELKEILDNLLFTKDILLRSIEDEDYSRLPLCEDWLCGRSIKTCVQLPRCITCEREFSNDYLLKKHKQGKRTSEHEVEYGTYEYTFDPMCKYFDLCGRKIDEEKD